MSFDLLARILAVIFISGRLGYWIVTAAMANRVKPKKRTSSSRELVVLGIWWLLWLFLVVQLLGWDVLRFSDSPVAQLIGLVVVGASVWLGIVARRELSSNWSHAMEYQVKDKQELVTSGVYRYIRHPIYSSFLFSVLGIELVAQSYLAIVFFVIMLMSVYLLGKREEKLLRSHFGQPYAEYVDRSWMLVPWII